MQEPLWKGPHGKEPHGALLKARQYLARYMGEPNYSDPPQIMLPPQSMLHMNAAQPNILSNFRRHPEPESSN